MADTPAKRPPKPRRLGRVLYKTSHAKKEAFLELLAITGSIRAAAAAIGVSRNAHYFWLENDPKYAEAYQHALEDAADLLTEEARRRAIEGIKEPIVYQGRVQGYWVDMSGRPVPEHDPARESFVPYTVNKKSDYLLGKLLDLAHRSSGANDSGSGSGGFRGGQGGGGPQRTPDEVFLELHRRREEARLARARVVNKDEGEGDG